MPEFVQRVARVLFHIGCYCLSIGLASLGILSALQPSAASELYGIPASSDEAQQWVRVAGLRDLGLAISAFVLYISSPGSMRVFVPTLLPIPIGDAMITLANGGREAFLGACAHLLGTVAIAILAVCAWLGAEERRPKGS